MPNIIVKVPEGAFDEAGRAALGKGIHAAAKAVEGWGDDPRQEVITWVLIEEVKPGCLFAGGADQTSRIIPVIVFFYPPAGVIRPHRGNKARASSSHRSEIGIRSAAGRDLDHDLRSA